MTFIIEACIRYNVYNGIRHSRHSGSIGYFVQKRFKQKNPKQFPGITNIDRALEYFDKVYPPVYGERKWDKMRMALMNDIKYAALLNNFADNEKVLKIFEELGAYEVGAFYTENVKNFNYVEKENKVESPSVDTVLTEEEFPRKIRPSLIELTDDEKAALANESGDGRYPEIYKLRAREALEIPDMDTSFTRHIKASQLSGTKSSAIYSHIPSVKLKGLEDWIEESDVLTNAEQHESEIGVKRFKETKPLAWPPKLKLFSFVIGEVLEFPPSLPCPSLDVYTHYLFNGSSILPVLALDLKCGEDVLDMCASPGGKSLAMLQTFLPGSLVCNDVSKSRLNRLERVIDQFIPKEYSSIRDIISISRKNFIEEENCNNTFDKVLVDAPCLNDRHSLQESDNSIFKPGRNRERLQMPELQAGLILAALKCTKPGGCVVYSTCTLSPIHNDGAVHLALTRVWKETKMECTVVDMSETCNQLSFMYMFGHQLGLRYGHLVLPYTTNNYGPMYICKIIKNK